jgi:glutathione S-transferase
MKLYVTYGSPYARLARIIVIEKAIEDRVEIIEAKTRTPGSPYYQINPSGRVPYLIDDTGVGVEDSQLICAYLDGLDGKPRFHNASHASDKAYLRLSSQRAACATALPCGAGKWPGRRTSVRRPLLPMSQHALSAWRIFSRTA